MGSSALGECSARDWLCKGECRPVMAIENGCSCSDDGLEHLILIVVVCVVVGGCCGGGSDARKCMCNG